MPEITGRNGQNAHAGILAGARPPLSIAALPRLRPLTLTYLAYRLRQQYWKMLAIQLMLCHFPAEAEKHDFDQANWSSIQLQFFGLVERADWFRIDWTSEMNPNSYKSWGVLDSIWDAMMNGGDSDFEFELAHYLAGIPVRCYGLTDHDYEFHPGLYALVALLDEDVKPEVDFLIDFEIYDNKLSKSQFRRRLREDDFSHLPTPLCWLPDIAGVATRDTGNVILDTSQDVYDPWTHEFTWEEDIDLLREDWQRAKPIVAKLEKFVKWLSEDESHVAEMVWTILGENHD